MDNAEKMTVENTVETQEERTFTQEEVNNIVKDRLARDRAKAYDEKTAYEAELKTARERADALNAELESLKAANVIRDMKTKVANDKGIPVSLLTGNSEEECVAQADAILAFAKTSAYPVIKDAGEVTDRHAPATPKDAFDEWFDATLRK